MALDTVVRERYQQVFGELFAEQLVALHANGAQTTVRNAFACLNPEITTAADVPAAVSEQYNTLLRVQHVTHARLVDALLPPTSARLDNHLTLAQKLVPVLNALSMGMVDARYAHRTTDFTRQLEDAHNYVGACLEELDEAKYTPEASYAAAGILQTENGLQRYRQDVQAAIATNRLALNGFIAQYHGSYASLVDVARRVVDLFSQETARIAELIRNDSAPVDPDDSLDPFEIVDDYLEALCAPFADDASWLHAEKNEYLDKLHVLLDSSGSIETGSRWASDITFSLRLAREEEARYAAEMHDPRDAQDAASTEQPALAAPAVLPPRITREQAYDFADALIEARQYRSADQIEDLRGNVRAVLAAQGSYEDALEYVALLDSLQAEPAKRAVVKRIYDRLMGDDINLPYAAAKDVVEKEAKDKFDKPESLEYLCANLATATSTGCTADEARNYAAFMERFQTDPKRQDFARRVFTQMKGAGLPYAITMDVVEGGCAKPDGTSGEELGKWLIDTTFAISQGCTYTASQTFAVTIAARESLAARESGVQPDARELGWRVMYARGLGQFKLPDAIATQFADDHMEMQRTAAKPSYIEHWYNAVTFGLQRDIPYGTSRELAAATVSRVDQYQHQVRIANWLRFAGAAVLDGVSVADAEVQADAALVAFEQRQRDPAQPAGQPDIRYIPLGEQRS